MQNQKSKIKNQSGSIKLKVGSPAGEHRNFDFYILHFAFEQKGITLLLVVVLLSAILSIGVGIFNVVLGELRISGEVADSFRALYAADQGIERTLYLDRQVQAFCTLAQGPNCFVARGVPVQSEGCYTVRISKQGGITEIIIAGQYRCGESPARVVKRGFQVTY